jgi:hypothetical protein
MLAGAQERSGLLISAAPEVHETGTSPGSGTFTCLGCGTQLSLEALDQLPDCPRCGESGFRRASMFEHNEEHPEQTIEYAVPDADEAQRGWLEDVREELSGPGRYLVCMAEDEDLQAFQLDHGWNRIGRSATADVRLDDPTVSRRHALVVWEPGEPLRVLDDRSLNGIFLNGELTDWGTLADGDELTIGRYRLFLIEA